jgi:hypothetical protein
MRDSGTKFDGNGVPVRFPVRLDEELFGVVFVWATCKEHLGVDILGEVKLEVA